MITPDGQDDWRRKQGTADMENGHPVGREQRPDRDPGTPSHAVKGEKTLRRPPLAVKDGLEGCRELLHAVGEGRVSRAGERGEPKAAAGHQMRPASDFALPPDHGTPDDLGGEAQRAAG